MLAKQGVAHGSQQQTGARRDCEAPQKRAFPIATVKDEESADA